MIIRAAREADAPAMGQVMVESYMTAHRGQMPEPAWDKRAAEWTPEVSAGAWARTLRDIAADSGPRECVYVAEDDGGELVGVAMGSPADEHNPPQTGAVDALYVRPRHQRRGVGRRLVQAVAADLARQGIKVLHIECLAANAPARRFYESIGGRPGGERLFDEEGFMLPTVVYVWDSIETAF